MNIYVYYIIMEIKNMRLLLTPDFLSQLKTSGSCLKGMIDLLYDKFLLWLLILNML